MVLVCDEIISCLAVFSFVAGVCTVALEPVTLLANDVTISILTPFIVFTMVEQLVCGAEDDMEVVVCD